MTVQQIATTQAPAAIGPYSQGVSAGGLCFTSGQLGIDPATGQLVTGGVAQQTHQVMANLQAVLAAAGADFSKVVKTTIFVKDMNDFVSINEVYASYLEQPYPARSTVEVARLPKDGLVEIEMIASLS